VGTDATRRTWLAAERTWLAWWRTGLGAAAVAIAIGRILPGLTGGTRWPYGALGLGYGVLAIAVLVIGAIRQRRTAEALNRGGYDQVSGRLVMVLTGAAVLLSGATLVLVSVGS
jgi:putative membrane protein